MTFLAPFIAPVLAAIRWLGTSIVPALARGLFAHALIKAGVGLVTGIVVYQSVMVVVGFMQDKLAALAGSAPYAAAAMQMLSLFGVFEAMSLILSAYIAKATWIMMKPSLTLLTPPQP